MAKLTGAKKKAFLDRMAKGRKKAARNNPKPKAAKKAKRKAPKKAAKKSSRPKKATKKKRPVAKNQARSRNTHARSQAPKRNPKGKRRRNSDLDDAVKMYESFHQKAPGKIVEYEEFVRYPGNFAEMGKLKKLRVFLDEANPDFEFNGFGDCQVLCTPDGQNLYLMGGDQKINLAALDISSEKDIIELGPCTYIMYHTTKGFHDFEPTDYWHRFGEEDGVFPRLGYDRLNGRMFFIGGNYHVKREGIVN